jgi:hypothetical protein
MIWLKIIFLQLVKMSAPFVTLFYRSGWYVTPDNPHSPHGMYERKMAYMHARFGTWFADWWWLGVRNTAYGLAYRLKPQHFKLRTSYDDCEVDRWTDGWVTVTDVDGYREYVVQFSKFHVIAGYRLTPIYDEVMKNRAGAGIPYRQINLDARPIISIRAGVAD